MRACSSYVLLLLSVCARAVVLDGPNRLAVELKNNIMLKPNVTESKFPTDGSAGPASCVITTSGGFSVGLPTAQPMNDTTGLPVGGGKLRKNLMNGLLVVPATVLGPDEVQCTVPPLGSAGNTSVCVCFGTVDPWGAAPPSNTCNGTFAQPAYFERFALFSPQFGLRPYFNETSGSLVVMTDRSLKGMELQLSATINGSTQIRANITGGNNVSIPFSLENLPQKLAEDVEISLSGWHPDGVAATHTRRFLRAPPPAIGSGTVAWQVDHTIKGLRADGVPFVAMGWFGSGGLHETTGMPPRVVNPSLSLEELEVLSTASVTTEWARQVTYTNGYTLTNLLYI